MRASDVFDTEEEFEELLELADRGARSATEREFVESMIESEEEYGLQTFISAAQHEWLKKLADR